MTPARYIGSGILPTAIDVNDALLAAIVLVAGETLSIPFCVMLAQELQELPQDLLSGIGSLRSDQ